MDKQMDQQLTNKDFFFCYNRDIYFYLTENNVDFITIAREPKNNRMFSLFHKTKEVDRLLAEYNKQAQEKRVN